MSDEVRVLGVPSDYGQDRRGVDMGPSAIRYGGLADQLVAAGRTCRDAGDLLVPRAEERDPDYREPSEGNAKFLRETEEVVTRLADETADALANGQTPLVLGGDHSVAIGTIGGAAREADLGAIWFDAHGDFNTPSTSPSGNVHGMPLAAVLGVDEFEGVEWAEAPGLREGNVVIVGLRSVDESERRLLRESDVKVFTMSDIDERGIRDVTRAATRIASAGVDGVHVYWISTFWTPTRRPASARRFEAA